MIETNVELWNRVVNNKWPTDLPVPTDQEAIAGVKRLYRKAMGRPWRGKVKVTTGNRHTWVRYGTLHVNCDERRWNGRGGWPEIVHSIAHYAHQRLHPRDRPHSTKQLYIERDLTDYVIAQGWLNGKLKRPDKPKDDPVVVKYKRILARETNWNQKAKRASKALWKVRRERKAYEARHGNRVLA